MSPRTHGLSDDLQLLITEQTSRHRQQFPFFEFDMTLVKRDEICQARRVERCGVPLHECGKLAAERVPRGVKRVVLLRDARHHFA